MLPASAGLYDKKPVTSALTGPRTLVMRLEGRNVFILQGELMGLISGLILSDPHLLDEDLFSDHLNAVRLIDDSKTAVDQQAKLRCMNGRSYYRWILRLVADNPLRISYTPGHSDEVSIPARLNSEADHYASHAQRFLNDIPTAPIPTFYMDEFTLYTAGDGWIESNTRNFVEKSLIRAAHKRVTADLHLRMALHLYDPKPPPDYSYTLAYSAYSADKLESPMCRVGCDAIEDQHHVFVLCTRYDDLRTKARDDILTRTVNKLDENIEEAQRAGLLKIAKSLFSDDPTVWPLHYSAYYLGHIPKFDHAMPKRVDDEDGKIARKRLAHHFAADWHTASI
ncbi:hypothetical protein GGX14DRAFT_580784 [Mycena pura]|uniref:Uncharacterized protein n=1 Tax=Mycena pura TaxID=153505 RepID=A0AAD6UK96_9AGAR|nr:hypothetical protein GGX14DRAFT_580784 [Mycena pura]